MERADQAIRRAEADEHYADIGRSVAKLVVECNFGTGKAWSVLGGIGLYRRWMLEHWVDRYREELASRKRPPGRPKGSRNRKKY